MPSSSFSSSSSSSSDEQYDELGNEIIRASFQYLITQYKANRYRGFKLRKRGRKRTQKMADFTEELEPLFDYHRVQPTNFISLDDDDSDSSPPRRRKGKAKVDYDRRRGNVEIIDCEEVEDEEDWLPPPPKNLEPNSKLYEDSAIKELRLKKQELTSLAKSAEDTLRAMEEVAKKTATTFSTQEATEEPPKPSSDRAKIVISIQDRTETKQYRVFADERFEQLLRKYAEKAKIDIEKLVFSFDGDKINPASTPKDLGMEDEDIIEVNVKPT